MDEPIGYDYSCSMWDLRIKCPECADNGGEPMYAGDEWGGPVPDCEDCGAEICGLIEVSS